MSKSDTERVKDVLPDSPFRKGGGLSIDTGEGAFVPLEMHQDFKDQVEMNRLRGVSIWALAGPVGIGRTWTLAWLARKARFENLSEGTEIGEWDAALIEGIGSGEIRDFYEAIFSSTEHIRNDMKDEETDEFGHPSGSDPIEGILNHGVKNRETWSVLTGNKGRFPSIRGIEARPRWKKRDTQIDFLRAWLKKVNEYGLDNLVILVDEFEKTATRLSSSKMMDFSDGLRRLYDIIEESQEEMPNIQIILSASPESVNQMDPQASSQNLQGWLRALQSRMDRPFYLTNIDMDGAKEIAAQAIDYKRAESYDDPFYPYEERAIEIAFEASDGLTRRFTKLLKEMHVLSYTDEIIDEESAHEAVAALGLDY